PIRNADVAITAGGEWITVRSRRAGEPSDDLRARYRPAGPARAPTERERFLIGGDRIYTVEASGEVSVIEADHGPWELSPAELAVDLDALPARHGLPGPPDRPVAVYQRTQ